MYRVAVESAKRMVELSGGSWVDFLVRAKLENPGTATQLSHSFGTLRCNSKHGCLTCPHIDNERTNYTFKNIGEVREIKQQMTCKSTNLIYMIECKRCKKQYIA